MDPAQLQPGHRLDRYELLCPLAYGGMASVWLARFGGRKGFERLVVIKMILPQYAQDPRFQEMFLDEARIASRIEHQNVARILDVGEHLGEQEENTFMVMEWVDGDSLSKVVRAAEQKKQRIPAGVALRICADAAAGLHAAHVLEERDGTPLAVVHRDVSPQNILISNAGTTVIIDFGVAKARDRVSQETSAGQLKGKIRYMAPEQALGHDIDRRADVWAVGAILYEIFAGVPPYDGPNEVATLHKLTSGARPAPLPADVPGPIRAVVDRALAYEVEERYATALELNLAIEACLVELGEPATSAVVAQYTGRLLTDRKAARKRAVDAALAAAHARDAGRTSSWPTSAGASNGPPSYGATPSAAPPRTPPPPALFERELTPSPSSGPPSYGPVPSGTMGFSESPSATSSATLGSAAMEYPPRELPMDDPARRRRFVAAAVLGVSIAAGVIGVVLIVTTAVLKSSTKDAGGTDNGASQATAPLEATESPFASSSTTATPATTATTAAPATTATTAAEPTAPSSGIAMVVPSPAPSTTPALAAVPTTPPTTGASAVTTPHRSTPPVVASPRPRPPPPPPAPAPVAPTGKSPDRGF